MMILKVKCKIDNKAGISPKKQRLSHEDTPLMIDDKSLADYDIPQLKILKIKLKNQKEYHQNNDYCFQM